MPWVTKSSRESYPPPPPKDDGKMDNWRDWWHYYKWLAFVGVLAVFVIGFSVWQIAGQVKPDARIGYVAAQELPPKAVPVLEQALAAFCADQNGDGRVVVELKQYVIDFNGVADPLDSARQMLAINSLNAEIEDGLHVFLLDDPAGFQLSTGALQYLDGTLPAQTYPFDSDRWPQMTVPWSTCPALAALDLGDYTYYNDDGDPVTQPTQSWMDRLSWARCAAADPSTAALWQALTEP